MAESVDIVLKARDEASSVFSKARTKIEGNLKGFERSFTELQSKMSFLGQAGRIAFDSINAAIKASKGDWEGMQEIVEQLPLGIGEIARAMRMLGEEISGAADEMARFTGQNDRQARTQADKNRQSARRIAAQGAAESQLQSLRDQTGAMGLTGLDAIRQQRTAAIERNADLFRRLEENGEAELSNKLFFAITSFYGKQIDAFREAQRLAEEHAALMKSEQQAALKREIAASRQLPTGALQALINGNFSMFGFGQPKRQAQIQASPLAPVVEGSRLTGRTAAAQAERQAEFVKRQAEQQKEQTNETKKTNDLLTKLLNQGKDAPRLGIIGIGN